MTHHNVQFKSAIPKLGTVGVWNKNVLKERLKSGVEAISLSSVGSRFHARAGAATENALSPNLRRVLGTT